jgi:dipeptidyl aminopeptidase/acylaminoacyl peptidase
LDEATATMSAYTVYAFHFTSDNKKITGIAHIPNTATSENKKPVIVQFRGYVDREKYFPGEGTQRSAEVYAANGFISLAPDFLGYGGSDMPSTDVFEERFETYTTALNLLASVSTLPMADPDRIGVWGHSNGGQIALTALEILGRPVPAVLWAPVSKPFPYSILYYTDEVPDHGKLLRKELAKFEEQYDAEQYSLANYVSRITGSVQIHQGSADTEVPIAWSDTLAKTLEASSSAVNYFVYPGTDHNMLPDAWNTVISRDVTFFEKYLR